MAGISNVISDVTFTNYVDRAVPHLADMAGYYLFGTDGATSTLNLAPGATVNLTANGTPTYGAGDVSLDSSTDYYSSGISVSTGQTLVLITQKPTATEYMVRVGAGTIILRGNGSGTNQIRVDGSGGGGTCIATFNPGTAYGFVAVTHNGTTGSATNLYVGSGGTLSTTTNGSSAFDYTPAEVLIGASGASSTGGTYRLAAACFADSVLDASQLTELYQYFRFAMPKRGVPVM